MNNNTKRNHILFVTLIMLCTLACFVYYLHAQYITSFVNDEFQSASTALNFSEGKGLIRTDAGVPTPYVRGWPASVLLAGWIKIWGMSEMTCRSLSIVYGILFIASIFYISYKMFNSISYSVLFSLFCISESQLTKYFAMTRMYSLEMLLGIWLYYFLYLGITMHNPFKEKINNKILKCIFELFDFHWGYLMLATLLAYLSFENHVNSIIPIGGIVLFFCVQGIITKEKRYINMCFLMAGGIILFVINILANRLLGNYLFLPRFFELFEYYSSKLVVQFAYLKYSIQLLGSWIIAVILLLFVAFYIVKSKTIDNRMVYLFCIVSFSLFFYVFFSAGRYSFRERYMLLTVPFLIAIYLYGYTLTREYNKRLSFLIFMILILISATRIGKDIYIYTQQNSSDTNFIEGYSTISKYYDLQDETTVIPIVASYMRRYYLDQVTQNYVSVEMDRNSDFDIWLDFARQYPEGIVTVETIKMEYLKQGVPVIITSWTDRLAGTEIDNTNCNVSHYCFVSPSDMLVQRKNVNLFCAEFVGKSITINVNLDKMDEIVADAEVLFLKCNIVTNLEQEERYFQLLLPTDYDGNESVSYIITSDMLKNIDMSQINDVVIDSKFAVYQKGELKEYEYNETDREYKLVNNNSPL